MTQTGWMGEEPGGAPAMPVTARLLAGSRGSEPQPGAVLEQTLARSRAAEARQASEEAAGAFDADEYASALVVRGYQPGMLSSLTMKLADTMAELDEEEDKIERAAQREQRTRQMHERGQLDVQGVIARMADTDDGDAHRADQLRRRAASIRTQIEEASAAIAPGQQRAPDMYEQAGRTAHQAFAEATRARMDAAQSGRPAPRAPRPFGSVSRGAAAEQLMCARCVEVGATPEQSYLIHQDPDAPAVVELAEAEAELAAAEAELAAAEADLTEEEAAEYARETGQRYQPARAGGRAEIARAVTR